MATNEEVNRWIHSQLLGKCTVENWQECDCVPADYCSSSSPRSLLEEAIAFATATPKGWNELFMQIQLQIGDHQQAIQATAEQIAHAIYEAGQEKI